MLQKIIESSLDANKSEIAQLLYPVFVHMYLELVYNNHEIKARSFFVHFRYIQLSLLIFTHLFVLHNFIT